MSKRSVAFIKPEEPSFLKKLKAEVGYQEGPTIDTKREELENFEEKDFEENAEEQPTVVVLKAGDLTAEEVAAEKDRLEREEASAPADLTKPIIFKVPLKEGTNDTKNSKSVNIKPKKSSKKALDKRLLSFDNEEDDDV
ncbi:uncharacterized protein KIAA1143 homolog [Coccinella septempunctata]|uniref:uncharacterized protein KIAA1143 homolog n=1 Tax=Coccinella septempunctata TaxID=41139 RepID=UPI001D05E24D|nr:uncharacterized protein KIAA1143 homolog [Coccinella septempunctata]